MAKNSHCHTFYINIGFFLGYFEEIWFKWFILQMGAYHTLDLELNRKFTLGKQEWDSICIERIGKMYMQV